MSDIVDEAISNHGYDPERDFFFSLEPGDHLLYHSEREGPIEYIMVKKENNLSIRAVAVQSGRQAILWYNDPKIGPVEVEHEELHTDISGYDESVSAEQADFFRSLEPGDHFLYNYEMTGPQEYVVLDKPSHNRSLKATALEGERAASFWSTFWYSDPRIVPVEVEHEALHTDVGSYDESINEGYDPSLDLGPLAEMTNISGYGEELGVPSRSARVEDNDICRLEQALGEAVAGAEGERLDLSEICDYEQGYFRLAELLKEVGFKGVKVGTVPGGHRSDVTLRAYGQTVHKETGKQFLVYFFIAPKAFSVRPTYFDDKYKKEFVTRFLFTNNVPRELPYNIITPRLDSTDYGAEYDPDEAIPEFRKLYNDFLEVITSPVAHEELHGDLSGYDESLTEGAVVKTSYSVITPESAEEGDFADQGWIDEKGHDCEPDEFDREEGLDRVDLAVKFLEREGATEEVDIDTFEGSSTDYQTGEETVRSYHLHGFSEAELEDVHLLMKGKERAERPPEHHELHTDVSGYDEAVEKDRNIEEALGLYRGPEFEADRWQKVIAELRHELAHELTIREDNEGASRTVTGFTENESLVQFNRGASNGNQLIQTIVSCENVSPSVYGANTAPSMGVHIYGDEVKSGAIPESIEALLDFHDAYYVGGPNEKARSMGKPEPGDRDTMLKALRADPEYPALAKFYEEFVSRLFPAVPEHEELHTDVSGYDESLANDIPLTREEWNGLKPGAEVIWKPIKDPKYSYTIVKQGQKPATSARGPVVYFIASTTDKPDYPNWEGKIYYRFGEWYRDTPVEHEELHTDTGGYDESLGREIEAFLTESKEIIIDDQAKKEAVNWARETFRHSLMFDHGPRYSITFLFNYAKDMFTTNKTKPSASVKFQFGKLGNGEEYLGSIIVNYISPKAYSGGPLEIAIVDIVEGYPIPNNWSELEEEILDKYGKAESKFLSKIRRLKFFPRMEAAFEGFMQRLFAPVEHYEMHSDVGAYDEARVKKSPVLKAYHDCLLKELRDPAKEAFMLKTVADASPPGTISSDIEHLVSYAMNVIKGPWPEAEPLIIRYPGAAILYAENVLKERWPKFEEKLRADWPPEELERQKSINNESYCDPVWYAHRVMGMPIKEAVAEIFNPRFAVHGFDFEPAHEELHTDTGGYDEAMLKIDPAGVRIADYEFLRNYGRI